MWCDEHKTVKDAADSVYGFEVYMCLLADISFGHRRWRIEMGAICVQDERTCTHDPVTII